MRKIIDLETYPRRSHFEYFGAMAFPYLGLTANVDVTGLLRFAKAHGGSGFHAILWAAAKAANEVPELRQRVVDGQIVEFAHCNIGYTVAREDHTFCNCYTETRMSLENFLVDARKRQDEAKKHAGFVINRGGATCGDVLGVIRHVQELVKTEKGVDLEPEVRIIMD